MTTLKKTTKSNWENEITQYASKWSHQICTITGNPLQRRSKVLWFCNKHPFHGTCIFEKDNPHLIKLTQEYLTNSKLGLSEDAITKLILSYPGQPFYISRVDNYLNRTRENCCYHGMIMGRKEDGFKLFKELLDQRGAHYKTRYTPLFDATNYQGKHVKHPFKCESHKKELNYSMQDLNFITSCPCPNCRTEMPSQNIKTYVLTL